MNSREEFEKSATFQSMAHNLTDCETYNDGSYRWSSLEAAYQGWADGTQAATAAAKAKVLVILMDELDEFNAVPVSEQSIYTRIEKEL